MPLWSAGSLMSAELSLTVKVIFSPLFTLPSEGVTVKKLSLQCTLKL